MTPLMRFALRPTRRTWTFGLVGALAIALLGCSSFQGESSEGGAIAANASDESPLELALFVPLVGTPHLMAAQVIYPKGGKDWGWSSYDYSELSIHNYLFFDGSTKASRWLLPSSNSRFLSHQELTQTDPEGESKVQALIYNQVKADSNDDEQLNDDDVKTIALSGPSGQNYQELIQNIDQVQQIHQHNDQRVLVFYRAGEEYYVADIDFNQGKVISTQPLPAAPQ